MIGDVEHIDPSHRIVTVAVRKLADNHPVVARAVTNDVISPSRSCRTPRPDG